MPPTLKSLDVWYSELTPQRAIVSARLPTGPEHSGLTLAGTVRGPRCSRGSTLPATYSFVGKASRLPKDESQQAGSLPCAQALVTEPIFWSPDWPALYDVTVELRRGSEVIDQATRTIGLRPLTVTGKFLAYGGKTWILRGVQQSGLLQSDLLRCRDQTAALFAPAESLDESILKLAAEEGVLVVVELAAGSAVAQLSGLSRSTAVAIAVLPPELNSGQITSVGNTLLAHRLQQGDQEPQPDKARLVLAEVKDAATFASWAHTLSRAVIAYRPLSGPAGRSAPRAECDRLQRDLAPYGQYAGYVV